jgi:16S rRNA (guanine527-N7)-methyltransferase
MKDLSKHAYSLLGLRITPAQLSTFATYEKQLIEWNQRLNLTAITEPEKIRTKHFLDSLTCILAMRNSSLNRVVDVGTGAGFPGIPLKIISPSMQLTLIESVRKKANFCRHLVITLGLESVDVINERVEVVATQDAYRQQYDWAVARAVAPMPVLMEYLLPLVKIGGTALVMKGESGLIEAQESEYVTHLMGGRLKQIIPVTLPGVEDERYLISVDKTAATPEQYPRKVGRPLKKPLIGKEKK